MITSLTTGVSGLLSNQTKIDVTGNNISNVNTTAFKRSSAHFNAVLGQRLMGTGRNAGGQPPSRSTIGRGVTVGTVSRSWEQGRLKSDNVSTHLGLTNDGFFVARSGDNRMITRAGNFAFNSSGEFVTSGGLQIQGYGFDENGDVQMTELKDVKIDLEKTAPPKRTSEVEVGGNLSSEQGKAVLTGTGTVNDTGSNGTQYTFDMGNYLGDDVDIRLTENDGGTGTGNESYDIEYSTDGGASWTQFGGAPASFTGGGPSSLTLPAGDLSNSSQDVTVDLSGITPGSNTSLQGNFDEVIQTVRAFDAKGESHTLQMQLVKTDDSGLGGSNVDRWEYQLTDPSGNTINGGTGDLVFNDDGTLQSINGAAVDSNGYDATFDWDIDGNGTNEGLTVNFGDETNSMTQYAGSTTASFKGQNGYASGKLEGYEFTNKGILQLNYTNGNTEDLFQLALGRVDNKGGLKQEGDNMFSATEQSGSLRLGRAGEEFNVNVVSGALEQSNVDIATEFSELITAQRGYQASARVITTSDEVLQETVQLKR